MNELSPIVLFVYNRIEHTRKVIDALRDNYLAEKSDLYIFSDGPKNEESCKKVSELRTYLSTVDGFKSVNIIQRESNLGLADSIISGVTDIINKYNKIIVLEDDIVTSKYFLIYMNDALDKYIDVNSVMSISGYIPPIDTADLPDTFFLPWFECWGWGTWKRSWDLFKREPKSLIYESDKRFIDYVNVYSSAPNMWDQVIENYRNKIKTWAIFFYVEICRNNGFVLYPRDSLCRNIGLDGSGENCINMNGYDVSCFDDGKLSLAESVDFNMLAISRLRQFYKKNTSFIDYIRFMIKRILFSEKML